MKRTFAPGIVTHTLDTHWTRQLVFFCAGGPRQGGGGGAGAVRGRAGGGVGEGAGSVGIGEGTGQKQRKNGCINLY